MASISWTRNGRWFASLTTAKVDWAHSVIDTETRVSCAVGCRNTCCIWKIPQGWRLLEAVGSYAASWTFTKRQWKWVIVCVSVCVCCCVLLFNLWCWARWLSKWGCLLLNLMAWVQSPELTGHEESCSLISTHVPQPTQVYTPAPTHAQPHSHMCTPTNKWLSFTPCELIPAPYRMQRTPAWVFWTHSWQHVSFRAGIGSTSTLIVF